MFCYIMKCEVMCSLILIIILSAIGTFLSYRGCNVDVKNGCLTKVLKDASVKDSHISTEHREYGPNSYKLHFTYTYENNLTCDYSSPYYDYMKTAEDEMKKYPIGKMLPIFVNKDDSSICTYKVKQTLIEWYAGIVLLSLAGLIVLIQILKIGYYCYEKFFLSEKNIVSTTSLLNNQNMNYNLGV